MMPAEGRSTRLSARLVGRTAAGLVPNRFRLPVPWLLAGLVAGGVAACGPTLPGPRAPAGYDWTARFPDADSVRVASLLPGVDHVYLWLPDGPWAVHVVVMDEGVCAPEVAAVKAGPPLDDRLDTSELGAEAVAAINADFFLIPSGMPIGAHVHGGRVLVGPGTRHVYALDRDRRHWAGLAVLSGFAAVGPDTMRIGQVNRPLAGARHHPPVPGLTFFDEWFDHVLAPDGPAVTAAVRRLDDGWDPRGSAGVIASLAAGADSVPLSITSVAFRPVGPDAEAWLARRGVGDTIVWRMQLVPAEGPGGPAVEALGGFPMLVEGGRGVYAEQTGIIPIFGPVRHPRTAVGWDTATSRSYWVVVDGRQPPYSDGMTLPELEWLFLRLGVTDAINLDGGGSTALVLAGRLANRVSEPDGERSVSNILALNGCR
jgi:hypothetical protein